MPDLSSLSNEISKVIPVLFGILQSGSDSTDSIANTIQTTLTQAADTYSIILAVISLVLGLLGCLFGYKLSRLFMALSGFAAGAFLGILIGVKFINGSNLIVILCAIAGGILLAFFSYKIYQAGIFVLCFFLAFIISANYIPLSGNIAFFLCTLCGFIIGILALKFVRPVIIIVSSFACAHSASEALMKIGPKFKVSFFSQPHAALIAFAALFVLGLLVQFLTTSDPDRAKSKKR